jgi:hypothetical protein
MWHLLERLFGSIVEHFALPFRLKMVFLTLAVSMALIGYLFGWPGWTAEGQKRVQGAM